MTDPAGPAAVAGRAEPAPTSGENGPAVVGTLVWKVQSAIVTWARAEPPMQMAAIATAQITLEPIRTKMFTPQRIPNLLNSSSKPCFSQNCRRKIAICDDVRQTAKQEPPVTPQAQAGTLTTVTI